MSSASTTTYSQLPQALATEGRAHLSTAERLLVGAIALEIPIQVDVSLFYDERWGNLGAIGGLNVSITTICLGLLYALWLLQKGALLTATNGRPFYYCVPLTAYLGIAALSVFIAQDKRLAFFGLCVLIHAYLIYTYLANRVTSRSDVEFVMKLLVCSLALQSAIMIAMRFVGHEVRIGSVAAFVETDMRVGGTLVTPNAAASYLELLIAPALALLMTPIGRRTKLLTCGALILGGVALFWTLSRGGWLATGLSVILLCLFAWRRGRISAWPPLTAAMVLLFVGVVEFDTIANRIVSNDQGAVTSRLPLMEIGRDMIADYPLAGVGTNNFAFAASKYTMRSEFREVWFHTIHNKYLLEWVELGVFGLAAFVWFLLSTLRTGWNAWQRQDPFLAPIALGLTVAIAGQMVHMMVDIFDGRPQVQTLWLCAGLIAAIYRAPEND
jgi:putative inorganic carbon (HCO3(-)) transporter